jgi:hypothetical protein
MPRTLFTAAHTTTQAPEAESFSITRSGSSSGITRNRGPGPPLSMMMHVYCVRPFGSTMLAWSLRVVNPIGKMWRSVWNPGRSGSILPCSSNTDSGCWICSWQRPEPILGYHFSMIFNIMWSIFTHSISPCVQNEFGVWLTRSTSASRSVKTSGRIGLLSSSLGTSTARAYLKRFGSFSSFGSLGSFPSGAGRFRRVGCSTCTRSGWQRSEHGWQFLATRNQSYSAWERESSTLSFRK